MSNLENAQTLRKEIVKCLGKHPRATAVRLVTRSDTDDLPEEMSIVVRYHDTDVVRLLLSKNGKNVTTIWLATGGWHTVTTITRITDVLKHLRSGWSVCRVKGQTMCCTPWISGVSPRNPNVLGLKRVEMPFKEGMKLLRSRRGGYVIVNPPHDQQVRDMIVRYVAAPKRRDR